MKYIEGGVEGHNVGINVRVAHGSRRLRGSLSQKFCAIRKSFAVPFAACWSAILSRHTPRAVIMSWNDPMRQPEGGCTVVIRVSPSILKISVVP